MAQDYRKITIFPLIPNGIYKNKGIRLFEPVQTYTSVSHPQTFESSLIILKCVLGLYEPNKFSFCVNLSTNKYLTNNLFKQLH